MYPTAVLFLILGLLLMSPTLIELYLYFFT